MSTLSKKKGNFQTCWKHQVSWNFCDDLYWDVFYCTRMVSNFLMGFLANRYQEQCRYVIWPKVSLTYSPPQKKGNFRKVAFLLGKSVTMLSGISSYIWHLLWLSRHNTPATETAFNSTFWCHSPWGIGSKRLSWGNQWFICLSQIM